MTNRIVFGLISLFISIGMISCKKGDLNPPGKSVNNHDWVELVSNSDKSLSRGEVYSEYYDFNVDRTSGKLLLQTDVEGNLLEAKMSRDIYLYLLKRSSISELESFPQNLLNQARKLQKQGYEFWGNSKFIPPMSKDKFDSKLDKCTSKPSYAGAVLCAANLLIEAIKDCLTATPATQSIHCW